MKHNEKNKFFTQLLTAIYNEHRPIFEYYKIMEKISIEQIDISCENLLTCAQIKHYASIG